MTRTVLNQHWPETPCSALRQQPHCLAYGSSILSQQYCASAEAMLYHLKWCSYHSSALVQCRYCLCNSAASDAGKRLVGGAACT
eukprot:1748-Heterococcus_DN1.PRE.3